MIKLYIVQHWIDENDQSLNWMDETSMKFKNVEELKAYMHKQYNKEFLKSLEKSDEGRWSATYQDSSYENNEVFYFDVIVDVYVEEIVHEEVTKPLLEKII